MEKTKYDDNERTATLTGGQKLYSIHLSTECYGEVCPIHSPSDHKYLKWNLIWNSENGSFFRVSKKKGKTVIDPDDYNLNIYGAVMGRNAAY